MSIGVSYHDYWFGDPWLIVEARKADKMQFDRRNYEFWLQGLYIYEAMADVSPLLHAFAKKGTKATPYRTEPYKFGQTEKPDKPSEQEAENERLKAALFFKNWARANQKR